MSYEQWPYLTVLIVLLAAGMGLPIPEDIPLLTAGYLCHIERASLPIMIAVGLGGVLVADIFLFAVGRRFGHRIFEHRLFRRLVNPARLLMAEELFARHGIKIIFFGRFLPVLRPMIFMAAGVLRVRPAVFLAVNGTAACISVPLMIFLGKFFGDSLDQIKRDVRVASHSMLLMLAVMALIAAAVWLHRRQKRLMDTTGVPRDLPPGEIAKRPPYSAPHPATEVAEEFSPPAPRKGSRPAGTAEMISPRHPTK